MKNDGNNKNNMTLWMVTYESDLTQFVVDAETGEKAIEKAIEANKELDIEFGTTEESDAENRKLYIADPVDFALLREIIRRKDYYGDVCDTVVDNG